MEQTSNTVILARVSSKSQEDEGYSLDAQLKLLMGYCLKNNLTVVRVFKIAETASKQQSRKIFHELLTYLAKANVYHLAVEKTDRFTRNFRDAVVIDEWLDQDDKRRLHAVKENLLLHKNAKSDVKFMWNIHVSVAKKYTDNLREEAMKGWAEKLAQGWLPSTPPPGYMTITENGKHIHMPNPETKDFMISMFKTYLQPGETIQTITDRMDQLGVRTRPGRPYSKSNVQRTLMNPFYIGINHFNGKDYPGAQEPIIPKKVFYKVQQKLHKGQTKPYVKHQSPLQGLIRCQDCGSIVTWQLQKGRYYGMCRRLNENCKKGHSLREDRVEAIIMDQLRNLVCPVPEVIDWVVDAIREVNHDSIEKRERLKDSIDAQLKRIDQMDDNLYDDKLSGVITNERYEVKHEQFMKDQAELYMRLNEINSSAAINAERKVAIIELSQKAAQIYALKPPTEKRLIISKLFSNLSLKEGFISVTYTKLIYTLAEKVQKTRKLMEA